MESVNLEREFDIEIIASVIENKMLTLENHPKKIDIFSNNILELCSFITGEEVNYGNLVRFGPIIRQLIIEQYPSIHRLTPVGANDLDDDKIFKLIKYYKDNYGDKLLIKSLKKGMIKTLKYN